MFTTRKYVMEEQKAELVSDPGAALPALSGTPQDNAVAPAFKRLQMHMMVQ